MVNALDENPHCGLAHCPMRVIDGHVAPGRDWWTPSSHFTKSSGDFLGRRHKRVAPFDAILCLLGDNIYSSVTQLLIRRSLFDKVGLYKADWGSLGDFHWNLRAGLAASAVHVPDTWGGRRMHPSRATHSVGLNSPEHQAKIDAMIEDVMRDVGRYVGHGNERGKFKDFEERARAREIRFHLREHSRLKNTMERRMFLFWGALLGKRAARQHLASLLSGDKRWPKGAPGSVSSWFDDEVLIPLA
jgi:hypothetical protein